jgi:peptidoglycan/LPS O-acetylase OafA/YrhL
MTIAADATVAGRVADPAPGRHLMLLDGLRGVAALSVLAYHFGQRAGLPYLLPHGYLAVDFFFVLSGFVLAYAYGERLRTSLAAATFILRRLIRLLPILLPGAAAGAVVELWRPDAGLSVGRLTEIAAATILSCLAIPLPIPTSMEQAIFPINGPVWSLFFELLASLVFIGVARSPAPSAFAWALMAAGGIGLAFCAWPDGLNVVGALLAYWLGGFPRVLYGFFAGVIVFANRRRFPALPPAVFPCALLAVFMLPRMPEPFVAVVDLGAVFAIFPLLVGTASNTAPGQAFRASCTLGGDLSYPLYAVHYPLVRAICYLLNRHHAAIPVRLAACAGGIVLIIGISWAVFRFYDLPVRRYLSRRLLNRQVRHAGPSGLPAPMVRQHRHAIAEPMRGARQLER